MKLVQLSDVAHVGGVDYDTYLLRDDTSNEVIHFNTKSEADQAEYSVKEHQAFQRIRREITEHHLQVLQDTDDGNGYIVRLMVERPLNRASEVIDLN
ncbi:MAG: hypothetical protein V4671_01685 [Armatimonadota bacterium]